ncbi:integrin alpha-M-like [Chanos chanos]|uniref:Integrin alpha-M-like n=1 Tax=Chanos chanos TaxID=29144 RepID=A0A6J2VGD5_CHACN|nr:integrin alpha-M-like [Chanos chanos]
MGFGYRVQQGPRSLLISDPLIQLSNDKRGQIYNCDLGTERCSELNVRAPREAINMSLGLSMTTDETFSTTLVCGPTIPKSCEYITTYGGMCFKINENKVNGPVPKALRDCSIRQTDVAFLLDGSGSVLDRDFIIMKNFVKTLIRDLISRDTQFAIAQYSTSCEIHIGFNNFQRNSWEVQLNRIVQQKGWTNTAAAINKVVNDVFNPATGARPKANRVLLVITDGQSNDKQELSGAAAKAERKNIRRYAIGVGGAFKSSEAKMELQTIASAPPSDFVFKVNNFGALEQIRKTLQENIIAIEGTQTSGDATNMELAQDGFSSAFISTSQGGNIVLGTVGALGWKGGYQEYRSTGEAKLFQNGSNMEPDSYLGYSMAVAKTRGRNFLILGAPRYNHKGRVLISSLDGRQQQELDPQEPQIGSYYGAEVCVVDLNSDSDTDLILISSPMYKENDQEGKVFAYTYSGQFSTKFKVVLMGISGERGRFGSSLASLADLNGDGQSDVAVGAPLENNGLGSVYIFNGQRGGINPTYSQRILGSSVKPGLQFFGLSLSQSSRDQSNDGLPDIAVGAKGTVLLLRSRPVVSLTTKMSYSPSLVSTKDTDCTKEQRITLQVCFTIRGNNVRSKDLSGRMNYTLQLDAKRQNFRAYFSLKNRVKNDMMVVGESDHCQTHNFFVEPCPEDVVNPLSSELTFSFEGQQSGAMQGLRPVLLPDTKTSVSEDLNFEINCGPDKTCIDNLKMDFNFSGSSNIEVGIAQELNLTVSVENLGENSYNSHVILTYPPGFSYRKFTTHQSRVECSSVDSEDVMKPGKTTCYISKPIFRANAKAVFEITYGIDMNGEFNQNVVFKADAASNNEKHTGNDWSKTKEIGVKYGINIVVRRSEDSTGYINFTSGKSNLEKPVLQGFEVENYLRDVNFSVIIRVPEKLGEKNIWTDMSKMEIKGCSQTSTEKPTNNDFVETLRKIPAVNCSVALCRVFKCNLHLVRNSNAVYNISGNISSGWIEQIGLRTVTFDLVSTATLEYDLNKYIFFSSSSLNKPPVSKIETQVEVYEEATFTKEIIGGAVGGLLLLLLVAAGLYKAGFFKSQYKEMMEAEDGADTGGEASAPTAVMMKTHGLTKIRALMVLPLWIMMKTHGLTKTRPLMTRPVTVVVAVTMMIQLRMLQLMQQDSRKDLNGGTIIFTS